MKRSKTTKTTGRKDDGGQKRDFAQMRSRRRKAARLFEKGERPAEVARRLGVTRQSASRWQKLHEKGGMQALEGAGRAGRNPKLDAAGLRRIEAELLRGAEAHGFKTRLWTLARVREVIRGQTGVRLHAGHVWRVLRRLGWSVQRPQARATQRDEKAIRRWIRDKWPAIKKKRGGSAGG